MIFMYKKQIFLAIVFVIAICPNSLIKIDLIVSCNLAGVHKLTKTSSLK
jgi:hypothetical protein